MKRSVRVQSLKSLIGMALQDWGSEAYWACVAQLQMRGSPATLAAMMRLTRSKNWRKRALGWHVLCQLRVRDRRANLGSVAYPVPGLGALLEAALADAHTEVLCAVLSGLGHFPYSPALPAMLRFLQHRDADIRYALTFALGFYLETEAVEALLCLAKDSADHVRDWATFGLGSQHEIDTPRVRQALWDNLQDSDEDVRSEALAGLAARKDERILPLLREALTPCCRVYELDSAKMMASPLLLPTLRALSEMAGNRPDGADPYWNRCLQDAIAACSGASSGQA